MANPEHIEILKKGIGFWNKWREENTHLIPDLRDVHLKNRNLNHINLSFADLRRFHLTESQISWANFHNTLLIRAELTNSIINKTDFSNSQIMSANFCQSKLRGSNFRRSDLSRTDFKFAQLRDTDLSFVILNNADLSDADLAGSSLNNTVFNNTILQNCNFDFSFLNETSFNNVDLSKCLNLKNTNHSGRSYISIETLLISNGKIPLNFLRGVGIPENFIEYLPSLLRQPIQFYSCFISHSNKDKIFIDRLYNDLQAKGVRCWFFPEDAKWGKTVWGEIDRGIKIYDKLMVVCSENSLQSEPVIREIERALQREDKEHKNILFPIRIDNYIFDKWEHERKVDVVNKVVGDFSGWDKDVDKYNKSLNRLIKALRAE